jgi:RES domain-containing protein
VQVWRLCQRKYQDTAFSGEGGLYASGRWHPKGFPIVYTSSCLALATLELFVHLESDRIPLVAIRALIDDDLPISEIPPALFPPDWQEMSAYPLLQELGKDWLLSLRSPILKVPSSIVPVEFNYLFNPRHPSLSFSLEPPIRFQFDKRMWKSL